jgi:hypothetical protein
VRAMYMETKSDQKLSIKLGVLGLLSGLLGVGWWAAINQGGGIIAAHCSG